MFHTIVKEAKELAADKKIWIGILTVLIIFIIGTSYHIQRSESSNTDSLKLGIINRDNSEYSKLLLSYFYNSETFNNFIKIVEGEEEEIMQRYHQGELDVYLEIPKAFADNMMKLQHSPVNVTFNIADTTKAIIFQNVLKSYEKYITSVEVNAVGLYEIMKSEGRDQKLLDDTNRTLSIDLIFTALGKTEFFDYQPLTQFPSTPLINYYLASIYVISNLYIGLYMGYRILKEMEQGTLLRIRTTMTSMAQLLFGKLIAVVFIFTLINSIISFIIIKGNKIAIVYYCFTIVMFGVCQAFFLCAMFYTTQRYILMGNLFLFYFTILGGGVIPIQFLPQRILLFSKSTPYYYLLKGMLSLYQDYPDKSGNSLTGLLLVAIVLLFLSMLLLYRRRSER